MVQKKESIQGNISSEEIITAFDDFYDKLMKGYFLFGNEIALAGTILRHSQALRIGGYVSGGIWNLPVNAVGGYLGAYQKQRQYKFAKRRFKEKKLSIFMDYSMTTILIGGAIPSLVTQFGGVSSAHLSGVLGPFGAFACAGYLWYAFGNELRKYHIASNKSDPLTLTRDRLKKYNNVEKRIEALEAKLQELRMDEVGNEKQIKHDEKLLEYFKAARVRLKNQALAVYKAHRIEIAGKFIGSDYSKKARKYRRKLNDVISELQTLQAVDTATDVISETLTRLILDEINKENIVRDPLQLGNLLKQEINKILLNKDFSQYTEQSGADRVLNVERLYKDVREQIGKLKLAEIIENVEPNNITDDLALLPIARQKIAELFYEKIEAQFATLTADKKINTYKLKSKDEIIEHLSGLMQLEGITMANKNRYGFSIENIDNMWNRIKGNVKLNKIVNNDETKLGINVEGEIIKNEVRQITFDDTEKQHTVRLTQADKWSLVNFNDKKAPTLSDLKGFQNLTFVGKAPPKILEELQKEPTNTEKKLGQYLIKKQKTKAQDAKLNAIIWGISAIAMTSVAIGCLPIPGAQIFLLVGVALGVVAGLAKAGQILKKHLGERKAKQHKAKEIKSKLWEKNIPEKDVRSLKTLLEEHIKEKPSYDDLLKHRLTFLALKPNLVQVHPNIPEDKLEAEFYKTLYSKDFGFFKRRRLLNTTYKELINREIIKEIYPKEDLPDILSVKDIEKAAKEKALEDYGNKKRDCSCRPKFFRKKEKEQEELENKETSPSVVLPPKGV